MNITLRAIRKQDFPALKIVLDSIELFPSEMLEEMSAPYFNNPDSAHIWFTAVADDVPVSVAYCAPETFTEGTFNLYAIGVRHDMQGKGIGAKMMDYLEKALQQKSYRVLIVETSSTAELEPSRAFYEKQGYTKEAVIRDFWTEGDDKVIYWKKLN